MKIDIQENSHANITFNNLVKVAVRGDHAYTVRYYLNNELAGEMNLGGGNWGGYEIVVGNWRIEFWQEDNLVFTYNHDLRDTNILVVTSFTRSSKGKIPSFMDLTNWINEIETTYGCKVYVYFAGSESFDLPFTTLKMNDDIDFKLMLEKQF